MKGEKGLLLTSRVVLVDDDENSFIVSQRSQINNRQDRRRVGRRKRRTRTADCSDRRQQSETETTLALHRLIENKPIIRNDEKTVHPSTTRLKMSPSNNNNNIDHSNHAKCQLSLSKMIISFLAISVLALISPEKTIVNCQQFASGATSSLSQQQQQSSKTSSNLAAPNLNHSTGDLQQQQSENSFVDLVAIGGITLYDPNAAAKEQQEANQNRLLFPGNNRPSTFSPSSSSGRLVDRIAAPLQQPTSRSTPPSSAANEAAENKLDYIIDFMRANKLTKFCDLLASQADEIKNLTRHLNSLDQFTLFVPTNEALLLMPSFEQIKRHPTEAKQFLMAHSTSELVVPSQQQQQQQQHRWTSSGRTIERIQTPNVELIFSLAGNPLRIATAPITTTRGDDNQTSATKLELIVNGANVLSGHSHALQEPLNSSATYAIVHLIDRPLYPAASLTLLDKIRRLAPKMAHYIELGRDQQLLQQLESSRFLTTALVPNDEAFLATPSKLLEQLETNRTFLSGFVRSHFVDGIYFSGQLSGSQATAHHSHHRRPISSSAILLHSTGGQQNQTSNRLARQLISLAGSELEFDTKSLQSRQIILVNSIPLVETDSMALNGVVHTLARPLFDRHHLEACNCVPTNELTRQPQPSLSSRFNWPSNELAAANNNRLDLAYELESNPSLSPPRQAGSSVTYDQPTANGDAWFSRNSPSSVNFAAGNTNELEREESRIVNNQQQQQPQRTRSQRSGSLVSRNNRDFYRPSIEPSSQEFASGGGGVGTTNSSSTASLQQPQSAQSGRLLVLDGPTNNSSTQQQQQRPQISNARRGQAGVVTLDPLESIINDGQLFEVERYKVVMNATSRQKLRQQQQQQQQTSNPTTTRPENRNRQFSYDQPLLSTQNSLDIRLDNQLRQQSPAHNNNSATGRLRQYSPAATSASPDLNNNNNDLVLTSSSTNTQRQQRLLKFQPDDAVLVDRRPFGIQLASSRLNSSRQLFSPSAATSQFQQQQQTKNLAGFNGCAFYDTECKRLVGKLVRLPPQQQQFDRKIFLKQQQPQQFPPPAMTNFSLFAQTTTIPSTPNLDSTFGESTESPLGGFNRLVQLQPTTEAGLAASASSAASNKQLIGTSADTSRPSGLTLNKQPARISALNQPLPPWSPDEISTATGSTGFNQQPPRVAPPSPGSSSSFNNWLANDLTRIRGGNPATSTGLSGGAPSAQILLVPVKMFQDAGITMSAATSQQQQQFNLSTTRQQQLNGSSIRPQQAIVFAQQAPTTSRPSSAMLMQSQGFYTPTIRSQQTNFSSFDPPAAPDGGGDTISSSGSSNQPPVAATLNTDGQQQQQSTLAVKHHRQPHLQFQHQRKSPIQVMNDKLTAGGSFVAPTGQQQDQFDSIKQARKLVRQQQLNLKTAPQLDSQPQYSGGGNLGDISITSAKLTSQPPSLVGGRPFNYTFNGLATQASNQAPTTNQQLQSNQFVRSVSFDSTAGLESSLNFGLNNNLDQQQQQQQQQQQSNAAADFFQNRTIAEIMDDSGLRIDGQQVTFTRLKDCLVQADLLSLVTQTGSSLTIFMPTDLAFQRLVQQQAILHQRERSSRSTGSSSSSRKHLLPLVARSPSSSPADNQLQLSRLTASASSQVADQLVDPGRANAAAHNRLALDCSAPQVRQLLLDHLSGQLITPKQLTSDLALASLSGRQLLLSSVPSKKIVVVDGQPVIAATRAKNGMVYVVNKLLNLTHQASNVVELVENQPNLSTFHSYLAFSSLADRFKRETGPVTILAPTNEAFEQLSTAARQLINSDPSALADILRGHVVEGAQFGKLISMRNKLKTMNSDQTIEARVIKPNIYQLDNQLTSIRLIGTAGNGVVNSIDRLIVPPWLRVSMGSRPATTTSSFSGSNNNVLSRSPTTTEIDSSPRNVNLPTISNQPLTFEQPADRLLVNPATSNSLFNLATDNNSLDPASSFDVVGAGPAAQATSPLNRQSPFLRVANSSVNNDNTNQQFDSNLPGGRLVIQADDNNIQSSLSSNRSTTTSKNMQLIDKLASLMKQRKFVKYLFKAGLSQTLKPDMNYVILIPTDQAIDKLPKQIIDMLDRDQERLLDLINYHVLDTTFDYINTIPDGQTLNTLNEKDILFNWHKNNSVLTASGAVVLGGIQEENIALLIVDRVLYPTPGNLLNIVSKSPILSNFTQLIRQARLESQLALPGPYTLFAPSDIAFNQLNRRELDQLQQNPETARRFLLRHLSQPAIFTSSIALSNTTMGSSSGSGGNNLVPSLTIANSLGEDLTLRQRNDYFSVNEVNFAYADVAATNGVMHVIDGLL